MSFIWPVMLISLVVVPLFGLLYVLLQQRRRRAVASFGSLGFTPGTTGRGVGVSRHIPAALFLLGLAILLVALARPQATLSLPSVEGTVILAFDVSRSMVADDLSPTRMEAAKAAARGFVESQPTSVQIGVVAFSDGGFSVQVPTNDPEAILAAIDRLEPQRGTSLAHGILASLNTIAADRGHHAQIEESDVDGAEEPTPTPVPLGTYTSAVIVLLSDGDNNEPPDPMEAAQAAADRGVRIYTVGVGSPEGATLEIDGFLVHTQLNEAALQELARLTGGAYYNPQNEAELQAVYENLTPELVIKPEEIEVTSIFAGVSILVMLIGGALSLLWFGRVP